MVGRPSRLSRSGRETLPEVRNLSEDPLRGPKLVGRPSEGPEEVGIPSQRSESGWETLPEVRKCLETVPEVWNWLGGPPGDPKVLGDRPEGV